MCGACGKTATPDPVLGPVRTLRQQLLVAQILNALCSGLSGLPTVRVAGDGWMVRSATGASTSCSTVHRIWEALMGCCVDLYGTPRPIVDRLSATTDGRDATPDGVAEAVTEAGLRVAAEHRWSTALAADDLLR